MEQDTEIIIHKKLITGIQLKFHYFKRLKIIMQPELLYYYINVTTVAEI